MMRAASLAAPAARRSLALLAGCGAEHDELQEWMEQQRREVKPNVPPLSAAEEVRPAALHVGAGGRAVQHAEADASR